MARILGSSGIAARDQRCDHRSDHHGDYRCDRCDLRGCANSAVARLWTSRLSGGTRRGAWQSTGNPTGTIAVRPREAAARRRRTRRARRGAATSRPKPGFCNRWHQGGRVWPRRGRTRGLCCDRISARGVWEFARPASSAGMRIASGERAMPCASSIATSSPAAGLTSPPDRGVLDGRRKRRTGIDEGRHLHPYLDRRGPPALLARGAGQAPGRVRGEPGGLADHAAFLGPDDRRHAEAPGAATGARRGRGEALRPAAGSTGSIASRGRSAGSRRSSSSSTRPACSSARRPSRSTRPPRRGG